MKFSRSSPDVRGSHHCRGCRPSVALCALAFLGLLWFAGCAPSERGLPHRVKAEGTIAFVGASREAPWWPIWEATALKNRLMLGGFELHVTAPEADGVENQIALLKELESPRLRGVCVQPTDALRMATVLSTLRSRGVVVVTMLTRLDVAEPFPHAGVDEFAAGRAMANAIHEAVGDGGTIAILHDGGSTPRLADRYLGLRERLGQLPGLSVLREVKCAGTPASARHEVSSYMERFPRLGGWVSLEDWPLRGEAGSRFAAQLPQTCRWVTYGPYPASWGFISNGSCAALIGPDYAEIALEALRMCAAAARGEPLKGTLHLVPPQSWTRENLTVRKERWYRAATPPEPDGSAGPP